MGREAKVLSMPKTTSALGLPGVSEMVDASAPASPDLITLSVSPVSSVKASYTDSGSSKESWVSMTTSLPPAADESSSPHAVSPAPSSPHTAAIAAMVTARDGFPTPLRGRFTLSQLTVTSVVLTV